MQAPFLAIDLGRQWQPSQASGDDDHDSTSSRGPVYRTGWTETICIWQAVCYN